MPGGRPRKNQIIQGIWNKFDQMLANLAASNDDGSDLAALQRFVEGLQIITKKDGQRSLILNKSQEIVWHQLLDARERKIPARFICLKSRQLGISTLIEAFMFALAYHRANKSALVVAHDWKASLNLFKMTKFYYDTLPEPDQQRRPLLSSTHQQLVFAMPHNSVFRVSTAAPTLGRSGTLHYVHRSEVAFWQDAEDASSAVAQCIPLDWDTLDFWESTAFGNANLFADTWKAAESGESGFTPIFLTWKGFPDYFLIKENPIFSPAELDYQKKHDLSEGELTWAQQQRRDACNNDMAIFLAEYPAVPAEAFQYSGRPWFDPAVMEQTFAEIKDAPAPLRGRMTWHPESNDPVVLFEEDPDGAVEIWEMPQPMAEYVIGVDVGEGVGAAFTVIQVLKRSITTDGPVIQVAKFRSNRIRPEDAAEVIFQLGVFYGWAFVGVECNNHGHSTLSALTLDTGFTPQMRGGYPDIFYHVRRDIKTQEETKKKGWATDKVTRPLLFDRLKAGYEGGALIVRSKQTALEMQGFCFDPGRAGAGMWQQTYKNPETGLRADDELFSLGIAQQMAEHLRAGGALPQMKDTGY